MCNKLDKTVDTYVWCMALVKMKGRYMTGVRRQVYSQDQHTDP